MREMKSLKAKKVDLNLPPRESASVTRGHLVTVEQTAPGPIPLVVRPRVTGVDLGCWIAGHRDELGGWLAERGAVLFRGFDVKDLEGFEAVARALSGELMDYSFRSTPRSAVAGKVYTSTEYPADQTIPLHNEMSYTSTWPMRIWFFCDQPAAEGGETPIADSRRLYLRIPEPVRARFADRGVLYVRNYGGDLDLPWQNVFQTDDRSAVETFCRRAGIEVEWREGDRLRTRQRCQAVARHPVTGEWVWFNQAHLFHSSALEAAVLRALLETFGESGLPRNAYYGDGSPIGEAELAAIREALEAESVTSTWQRGDVLLLDNMLVAHGRRPFSGSRRVLVVMAEAMTPAGLEDSAGGPSRPATIPADPHPAMA